MSRKRDKDSPIKPRDLVFLLAIAGRIDSQSRVWARQLNKDRTIHHAYAVLDSLSSTVSMFKYVFEVFLSDPNDPELMHKIMTSHEGCTAIVTEAIFLVAFSFLASYFESDKINNKPSDSNSHHSIDYKLMIATAWPYFRDVMKGMKNAYRGWKSAVQITAALGGTDLKFMIIPFGLALGVISASIRIWIRYGDSIKDQKKSNNMDILSRVQKLNIITGSDAEYFKSQLQYQTTSEQMQGYLAMGLGGLIDSLYLYAGLMGLAVLSAPAFTAMAAVTMCYTVACVLSRLYEESEKQQKLLITAIRCKLTLKAKELETRYGQLLELENKPSKTADECQDLKRLRAETVQLIDDLEKLRNELKDQTTQSYATALLYGIRQGLFTYGVLASLLFTAVAVFSISAAVFPPALLIACISSGLAFILALSTFSVAAHHLHLQQQNKVQEAPFQKLTDMKNKIKAHTNEAECLSKSYLTQTELADSINNGKNPTGSPQYLFPDWLEVLRSFFSGLSKGSNFVLFTKTLFENTHPQEHEHDVPVMLVLTMASAALFSTVLALRALARGFRNVPLKPIPGAVSEEPITMVKKIEEARPLGTAQSESKRLPRVRSWLETTMGFFGQSQSSPPASEQRFALNVDTVPDLN